MGLHRRGRLKLALATVVTGVGAGLAGAGLVALLRLVQHAAFSYSSGPFLDAVEHTSDVRRLIVLSLAGVACGLAWFALRGSLAAESIPAVIVDGAIQVVSVALGSPLGREAAPKHVGSALGQRLGTLFRLTPAECTALFACGSGAGMAAVYDVPFGGALFALEVLLASFAPRLVAMALTSAWIATLVARIFLPDQPTYVLLHGSRDLDILLVAVVLGPVAGVLAVPLAQLWVRTRSHPVKEWRIVPALTLVFITLGLLSTVAPELLGNGRNVVQLAIDGRLGTGTVLVVLLAKPLVTAAVLRAGGRGGLFTPVLSIGAALGALAAQLVPGVSPGPAAVIGAAALLAGISLGPLSSVVLVVELTRGSAGMSAAVAVAGLTAWAVSRRVGGTSIYGRRVNP